MHLSVRRTAIALCVLLGGGLAAALVRGQDTAKPAQPARAKLSEAEGRKEAIARLRKVAQAFHDYHSEHETFPPAALVTKDGKALLSWRVLLLPYLGEEELSRQFQLTEPWDSPRNRSLLSRMPIVFAPAWGDDGPVGVTLWQVFTGPGSIFEGDKGVTLYQIEDGTSNTILLAEGSRPVPWTKPEDLAFDPKQPLPRLGSMFPDVFLFALADGSVQSGRRNFEERSLRIFITRNNGTVRNFDGILAPAQP